MTFNQIIIQHEMCLENHSKSVRFTSFTEISICVETTVTARLAGARSVGNVDALDCRMWPLFRHLVALRFKTLDNAL